MSNPSQQEEWGNDFHLKQMHTHTHKQTTSHKAQNNWIIYLLWDRCTDCLSEITTGVYLKRKRLIHNGGLAKVTCSLNFAYSFDLYTLFFNL